MRAIQRFATSNELTRPSRCLLYCVTVMSKNRTYVSVIKYNELHNALQTCLSSKISEKYLQTFSFICFIVFCLTAGEIAHVLLS
jgi:hypothetical protein